MDSVSKFDNLIKNKKRKTESRVQGSVQATQLCSECTLQKKIPLSVGLQLLWALPEPQETHSHLILASTALKGIWQKKTKKENPPFTAQMCSGACHHYVAGRILPSCPCPADHLGRKSGLQCWNLLSVTTATSACCKRFSEQPGGSQKKTANAAQTLLLQSGRKSGHNPFPNPGGQLPGSGKHLCWGKRTTTGNLHACSVEEKATVHTKFQEWWDTAGLRCGCWHKGLHNPAPSHRPVALRSRGGWPLLSPLAGTTSHGVAEHAAKITSS